MSGNVLVFVTAAFLEIAGCFAFWTWLRRGTSPLIALAGVGSLIGFAVSLTRADSAFAGRAYAAYGGIYIAASLVWLWLAEGQRPSATDLLGAVIAPSPVRWSSLVWRRKRRSGFGTACRRLRCQYPVWFSHEGTSTLPPLGPLRRYPIAISSYTCLAAGIDEDAQRLCE
jgi:small multidrug resistance family-3 protein